MFQGKDFPQLLLGVDGLDDAAVYKVNDDLAIVLTTDFFPPVVDNPYTYGAIAAANSMSDVYAMGGEVILALNIVGYPQELPPFILAEILRGGAEKVAEAGGVIAGGHTIYAKEPFYGLCVMGSIHPQQVYARSGARVGDAIVLTKPLGTAIVLTAEENGRADPAHVDATVQSMLALNRRPSQIARGIGVNGMSDVTGFGLMGHSLEMARGSSVAFVIHANRLPLLPGALDYARNGVGTGGGARNRDALMDAVAIDDAIPEEMVQILFDPQTSGGLLITLPPDRAVELQRQMAAEGLDSWQIGEITEGSGIRVVP
jgi:selenide,water dikinase